MAGQVPRTGSQGTRTQVITNSFEVRFAREPLVYNHYRGLFTYCRSAAVRLTYACRKSASDAPKTLRSSSVHNIL